MSEIYSQAHKTIINQPLVPSKYFNFLAEIASSEEFVS